MLYYSQEPPQYEKIMSEIHWPIHRELSVYGQLQAMMQQEEVPYSMLVNFVQNTYSFTVFMAIIQLILNPLFVHAGFIVRG
jgi:hypothetical protein